MSVVVADFGFEERLINYIALKEALRQLKPRHQHVLVRRLHGVPTRAIGAELDVCPMRVRQIEKDALQRLKRFALDENVKPRRRFDRVAWIEHMRLLIKQRDEAREEEQRFIFTRARLTLQLFVQQQDQHDAEARAKEERQRQEQARREEEQREQRRRWEIEQANQARLQEAARAAYALAEERRQKILAEQAERAKLRQALWESPAGRECFKQIMILRHRAAELQKLCARFQPHRELIQRYHQAIRLAQEIENDFLAEAGL